MSVSDMWQPPTADASIWSEVPSRTTIRVVGAATNEDRNVTVSVVIPALNEAESLPYVLARIPADVHEVILVDGASTDGTIEVAQKAMPTIRVVRQTGRGKGAALRDGFAAASGDIIVHLDADGSTDPAEIPIFVATLLAGADYAKGTRFIQGASSTDITSLRRLGNWAFVVLANLLFGSRFSDITYGYNAIWRVHCDKLAPEIDGWAHEIVGNIRAIRHGLRVVEVACRESDRIAGQAKLKTFSAGWTILLGILAERFQALPQPEDALLEPGYAATAPPMEVAGRARPALVAVPITVDNDDISIAFAADSMSHQHHELGEAPSTMAAGN